MILERKDCHWCDHGKRPSKKFKECPKCHGTGKRGNGRCRNCNDRNGYYGPGQEDRKPGYVLWYDHDDKVICERCSGNWEGFDAENYTDNIDISHLPIEVQHHSDKVLSWSSAHIGNGVYTIVDYGRHKNQTDEQIIEEVREELHRIQACWVVKSKDDLTLCDKIIIHTTNDGMIAVPHWNN